MLIRVGETRCLSFIFIFSLGTSIEMLLQEFREFDKKIILFLYFDSILSLFLDSLSLSFLYSNYLEMVIIFLRTLIIFDSHPTSIHHVL